MSARPLTHQPFTRYLGTSAAISLLRFLVNLRGVVYAGHTVNCKRVE